MTASDKSERWLARHVVVDGTTYGLSLVEIYTGNGLWHVSVTPFRQETHSTVYHPGTIKITTNKDPLKRPEVVLE